MKVLNSYKKASEEVRAIDIHDINGRSKCEKKKLYWFIKNGRI